MPGISRNLESKYTVVNTVTEWINAWRDGDVSQTIICTSRSIFANAEYAQPDNAFDYTTCRNVHDFLVKGLGLPLDIVDYETVGEKNSRTVPFFGGNGLIFQRGNVR